MCYASPMGWKNVKEHYRIGHMVAADDEQVYIGSAYVSKLIIIPKDGNVRWGELGSSGNDDLARYFSEMSADKTKLIELLDTPDTFSAALPVFTYRDDAIIETVCEKYGWPNVTHAGQIMYENSFSSERDTVVRWAKQNALAGISMSDRSIASLTQSLDRERETRKECAGWLETLNAEFPEVSIED